MIIKEIYFSDLSFCTFLGGEITIHRMQKVSELFLFGDICVGRSNFNIQ